MIYLIPALIIILFILILVIRTILIREKTSIKSNTEHEFLNNDDVISRFTKILQCKTINGNYDEFLKLRMLFKEFYPAIHEYTNETGNKEASLNNGIMYHIRGKDSSRSIVLMSHIDVVPANDTDWSYPPFDAINADGKIYGRGTLDTKCTAAAIMESMEKMLSSGRTPEIDIYICFGGDEETDGTEAKKIASVLKSKGVTPELILDEGGAVLNGDIIGMKSKCALVGIAEKGYMDVEFIARSKGGHTSLPTQSNPMPIIAEAIRRINKSHLFKLNICEPVKEMMHYAAKYSGFAYSFVFTNYSFFQTLLTRIISRASPEISALTRTIGSITMIEGSSAPNVIPEQVRAVGNFRILNGSSVEKTLAILKKALKGLPVEINILDSFEPSKVSKTSGNGFLVLKKTIENTFNSPVVPYLMIAGSDSRSYSDISDYIYRFSPIFLDECARKSIHGIDENIEVKGYFRIIEFYTLLLNEYF